MNTKRHRDPLNWPTVFIPKQLKYLGLKSTMKESDSPQTTTIL